MANTPETKVPRYKEIANQIAAEQGVDVLLINGPVQRHFDRQSINIVCGAARRRESVLVLVVTGGGDADAAYRIARCLLRSYKRVTVYVSGLCKSAGTLLALGAHELVFGDHGEIGPLDVQMHKKDELWERQSGLTINAALTSIEDKAFAAFEKYFLALEGKSGGAIRLRTAGEMASNLATGLFGPLMQQVDPIHVGEAARSMSIADHYGRRLQQTSGNWDEETLKTLLTEYPSHGFVIDREEAGELFEKVRVPSLLEAQLATALGGLALWPNDENEFYFWYLSDEVKAEAPAETSLPTKEEGTDGDQGQRPAPDRVVEATAGNLSRRRDRARAAALPFPDGSGDDH